MTTWYYCSSANEGRSCVSGKEVYSPEIESSPAPSANDPHMDRSKQSSRTNSFEIENLLKSAEQVTGFCRSPQETRKSSPTGSVASSVSNAMLTPSRQLTDAEKLRKVILELVDTEKTYVKVSLFVSGFGEGRQLIRHFFGYSTWTTC